MGRITIAILYVIYEYEPLLHVSAISNYSSQSFLIILCHCHTRSLEDRWIKIFPTKQKIK